jgi:hypothetical protein
VLSNAGRKTSHPWISEEVSEAYHEARNRWRQRAGDTAYGDCKPSGLNYSVLWNKTWGEYCVFKECREVERPVPVRGSQPDGVNMSRI